jgi:23S rRNA pseudouridine1911/1915/1917 synthase
MSIPPELRPRVVHLDEALAVVEKPAGLVVHPAPSHSGPTMVEALAEILGGGADSERPGIVHRLDKGTSGLLVVARTDAAHAALQEQVRRREVERIYLALAGGRLASRTGTIDAPIGRARQRHRMAVSGAASRQARTHFTVLELLRQDTYLEARLETGRTHQIRAHFAAIGHPLTGDVTYGGAQRYGLERQFLHAHRLAFAHPDSGERLSFSSPLPADLEAALQAARAA